MYIRRKNPAKSHSKAALSVSYKRSAVVYVLMSVLFHKLYLYTISTMVIEFAPALKYIRNYTPKTTFNYEDAITALNSLQSNAAVIQQSKSRAHNETCTNLDETRKYLQRCGISMNKLNSLSVIHVAGTKGKGSTSALCESILRSNGFRTGFFSSPHLVSVTERIKLGGKSINKDLFVKYFETVYKALDNEKEHSTDMPPYFKFLTILAFQIFISEEVDVAIIEVGIGGEHDCTNVLRKVSTVGITSLGLEHTAILGNTIEQIAWQKAGIIKPGCRAFTVSQQYANAMKVLEDRAQENDVSLTVVPKYESYNFSKPPEIQIDTEAQKLNTSLAVQLAYHWMTQNNSENTVNQNVLTNTKNEKNKIQNRNILLNVNETFVDGLNQCQWLGRFQIIDKGSLRLYLDGAHTIESMDTCVIWFKKRIRSGSRRALIFNATGDRNSEQLLAQLIVCDFEEVIFVPNLAFLTREQKDRSNYLSPLDQQMERCLNHKQVWNKLMASEQNLEIAAQNGEILNNIHANNIPLVTKANVYDCVNTALEYLRNKSFDNEPYEVLVTGSLHLIGSALVALNFESSNG